MRVGQQLLEVVLLQGQRGADDGGRDADQHDDRPPRPAVGEQRCHPCDQVDPGLDHRRRVQVGADRGRCDHGAGQPEVEGELGRLGEGAGQHEGEDHGGERAPRHDAGVGEDAPHVAGAGDDRHEHEPGEEGQPAQAGNEEGPGRGGLRLPVAAAADQEVREYARELPEDEEHDHIAGQHQPEHRRAEERQQGVHAHVRRLGLEVAGGVGHDDGADREHEEREEQREAVEHEDEPDVQPRHPGQREDDALVVEHGRRVDGQHRERGDEEGRERVAGVAPHEAGEQRRESRGRHQQQQRQAHESGRHVLLSSDLGAAGESLSRLPGGPQVREGPGGPSGTRAMGAARAQNWFVRSSTSVQASTTSMPPASRRS